MIEFKYYVYNYNSYNKILTDQMGCQFMQTKFHNFVSKNLKIAAILNRIKKYKDIKRNHN